MQEYECKTEQEKRLFRFAQIILIVYEYGAHSWHHPYMHEDEQYDECFKDIPKFLFEKIKKDLVVSEKEGGSVLLRYHKRVYALYPSNRCPIFPNGRLNQFEWAVCYDGCKPATEKQLKYAYLMYRKCHKRDKLFPSLPKTSSMEEMKDWIAKAAKVYPKYIEEQKEIKARIKEKEKHKRWEDERNHYNRPKSAYHYYENDFDEEACDAMGYDASMFT